MAITLTVGTDTYVSLADAKTYLGTQFFTTAWTAATDDNKSKALLVACQKIDRLVIRGVKAVSTQTLMFPRAMYTYTPRFPVPQGIDPFTTRYVYVESAVTNDVIYAQCHEANAILEGEATGNYINGGTLLSQDAVDLLSYYMTPIRIG